MTKITICKHCVDAWKRNFTEELILDGIDNDSECIFCLSKGNILNPVFNIVGVN